MSSSASKKRVRRRILWICPGYSPVLAPVPFQTQRESEVNNVFSSAYTPLITQSLSYLFCKFGGGSQCSGLSLCVTNFFLMLRYAAMSYVESRDDTKPQTRSVDFVGLSLMFCSFFYYCVTYYNATCVPRL